MKISIWQQFSSNHSAVFMVVGTFKTPDEAQKAHDELLEVSNTTQSWWDNLDDDELEKWEDALESETLSPIDQQLAQKYQIPWEFTSSWWDVERYSYDDDGKLIDSPIHVWDKFVFLHEPHPYMDSVPQPFNLLMEKLGGQVAVKAYGSATYDAAVIVANLIIQAGSVEQAQDLADTIQVAFDETAEFPTWIAYYTAPSVGDGEYDTPDIPQADRLAKVVHHFKRNALRKQAQAKHDDLYQEWMASNDDDELDRLREQYYAAIADELQAYPALTQDETVWIQQAVEDLRLDYDMYDEQDDIELSIKAEGSQVIMEQFSVVEKWVVFFSAFTQWLTEQGCELSNVEFVEIKIDSPY